MWRKRKKTHIQILVIQYILILFARLSSRHRARLLIEYSIRAIHKSPSTGYSTWISLLSSASLSLSIMLTRKIQFSCAPYWPVVGKQLSASTSGTAFSYVCVTACVFSSVEIHHVFHTSTKSSYRLMFSLPISSIHK